MNEIILSLLIFLAGLSIGFLAAYSSCQKELRRLMDEFEKYAETYLNELKEIRIHNQKSDNHE